MWANVIPSTLFFRLTMETGVDHYTRDPLVFKSDKARPDTYWPSLGSHDYNHNVYLKSLIYLNVYTLDVYYFWHKDIDIIYITYRGGNHKS